MLLAGRLTLIREHSSQVYSLCLIFADVLLFTPRWRVCNIIVDRRQSPCSCFKTLALVQIPIAFLKSAQVNNWTFTRYVVCALVCLSTEFVILDGESAVSGVPRGIRYEIVTHSESMEIAFQ